MSIAPVPSTSVGDTPKPPPDKHAWIKFAALVLAAVITAIGVIVAALINQRPDNYTSSPPRQTSFAPVPPAAVSIRIDPKVDQ